MTISEAVGRTSYPGRGIVLGKTPDARHFAVAYFIMGRSENSRNRVFVSTEDGIRTQAHDPAKLSDPSLIIYHPVRRVGDKLIVTNGDQTDTVRDFLVKGDTFTNALATRTFEPDAPNFTPRISALLEPSLDYFTMSIIKSADGDPACTQHQFFHYLAPVRGKAYFLHTYREDGGPLPSFAGEPVAVTLEDGKPDDFTASIWEHLDPDNRVSLYTAFIDIKTGDMNIHIVNKLR